MREWSCMWMKCQCKGSECWTLKEVSIGLWRKRLSLWRKWELDCEGSECWTVMEVNVGPWRKWVLDCEGRECWTVKEVSVGLWRKWVLDCEGNECWTLKEVSVGLWSKWVLDCDQSECWTVIKVSVGLNEICVGQWIKYVCLPTGRGHQDSPQSHAHSQRDHVRCSVPTQCYLPSRWSATQSSPLQVSYLPTAEKLVPPAMADHCKKRPTVIWDQLLHSTLDRFDPNCLGQKTSWLCPFQLMFELVGKLSHTPALIFYFFIFKALWCIGGGGG